MDSEANQRWIKYYSSAHAILLVGEGDFSFSLCLGKTFGSATNIVATSLDSYDVLLNNYKYALANLVILGILGASVLHGVDATQMMTHPELRCKKFDRIIYNFPHAGFYGKEDNPDMMMMHRELVRGFLQNACSMLDVNGEIHVNHKTTAPFDSWKIEDLGSACSLVCIAQDEFRIEDYPGYNNKRGSGSRADEPFPLGACKTYRFRLCPVAVNCMMMRNLRLMPWMLRTPVGVQVQQQAPMAPFTSQMFPTPPLVVQRQPLFMPVYDGGAALRCHESKCRRIYGRYLNHAHAEETFGDTNYDVQSSVDAALPLGHEMHVSNAVPGRPWSGNLEEVQHLSISRSERLRQMVFRHGLS
ncbi:heavy metal-associated isoprenylated plant protein 41-like [Salvia miltiorrhiza]|uniref:heavy metal-associated isoprenylated plant protein 41-like n=1 Tax=Salvia miltiorrhiza TaxID=226208 RepID=UPI0025ABEA75|nr:heavy metal-associated isoprenylated plant protein 41-like [Salvia miltiorrhiza]